MQGAGVGVPKAAVVAAATVGLLCVVHIPKGIILDIGAKSIIVAAGFPPIMIVGRITFKTLGASPNVQRNEAPITTN
jgi:hypothetical protein